MIQMIISEVQDYIYLLSRLLLLRSMCVVLPAKESQQNVMKHVPSWQSFYQSSFNERRLWAYAELYRRNEK